MSNVVKIDLFKVFVFDRTVCKKASKETNTQKCYMTYNECDSLTSWHNIILEGLTCR